MAAAGLLFYLLLPAASGVAASGPGETSPSIAPSPTDALVTLEPMPTGSPTPTTTATQEPTPDATPTPTPTPTPGESEPPATPEPTVEPTEPAIPAPTESPPDEETPSPTAEPTDPATPAPSESPPETTEPDPSDDPPTLTPEPTASPTEEPIAELPPSEVPTPEPVATPPADSGGATPAPQEVVEEPPATDEAPAPATFRDDPAAVQQVTQPAAPAPMPTATAAAAPSVPAEAASNPVAAVLETQVLKPDLEVLEARVDDLSHLTDVMADQSARLASEAAIPSAVVLGAAKMPNALAVAVEFGRAGNGWAGALVFNIWLRRQLRERRMTQRQLAAMSGVNHSTISRLLTNGRAPSLETATKLAHALRHRWSDEQVATYFDLLAERPLMPTQRVESALRGDDDLTEDDVRTLMEQYLVARAKRRQQRAGSGGGGYHAPMAAVAGNRQARGRGATAGRQVPPARR